MGTTDRSDSGETTDPSQFSRSHVVLVDRFDRNLRPYVILSTDELPNDGEQYIGAPLTTEETHDAVVIEPSDWTVGEMDRRSYALASDVSMFYSWTIERGIGAITEDQTDVVARRVGAYLGVLE